MGTKANKHRGRNRYHGRGKKAGRGAGKRGGRGNAGMNKHRVMTRIKYMPDHWGMHGFNRHPTLRTVHVTCNVSQLKDMADGKDSIDLSTFGIDKLLGSDSYCCKCKRFSNRKGRSSRRFSKPRSWRRLGRMGRRINVGGI